MNKRITFKCCKCDVITSKTAPNYYKQKRKIGMDLCGSCATTRNIELSSIRISKYNKRNNVPSKPLIGEIITLQCDVCGKMRQIQFRNINKICPSCAAKKTYQDNKQIFQAASKQRIGNREFGKSVSVGMLAIPKAIRVINAKNASSWWKDAQKKSRILAKRLTDEYRQKMRDIWNRPGYREKMAVIRLSYPRTSSQQDILYSILTDLKVQFSNDQSVNCKIGWYAFDCRIDPQSNLMIAKPLLIEVQGDYWHNREQQVVRDRQKATYLRTYFPEFDLKYLWEHEFNNKDRVVNLIKYWLGLKTISKIKIEFDKVEERIIDYKTAELFISKYHYAGRVGRSGINLGYFYDNELIGVIIYSTLTRQETAIKLNISYSSMLELSRLAIHPQYQVKNLASNIISRSMNFIKKNNKNIKCLVSFADSTYNHSGIIYKASNWKLDGVVPPDYWYADNQGYICHKKTLWNKAKKMSMTENEYCVKFNYMKVWGKSKTRFVYFY